VQINPTAVCPNCGTEFSVTAEATPCPSCAKVLHRVSFHAVSKAYPDMEARAIPPGRGRSAYFQLIKSGYEFFRNAGRWHLRERSVDRRSNRYREHIEDAETGEVIRDKDQRLDEHIAERDLRKRGHAD
jgi:hypothetical protein